jgi:DNA repair protein RecN (Recombination protein N)
VLHELHIESLGVIESLDVVLGPGLTVLTGETGAGKTMLVEAIDLLVGARADPTIVRAGAAEARVEGRFVAGDDELVVARVIPVDGRSRAYVNGRLAAVGTLAEIGSRFVDLHGQHAHQSLLAAAHQRAALDRFCHTDLEPLRAARARLTEIDATLAALGGDSRSRAREIDLLRFQLDELRAAAIRSDAEDDELDELEDRLGKAVEHRDAGERAVVALTDEGAAADDVGESLRAVAGRSPYSGLEERLRTVAAEIADIASELRSVAESIDEDPHQLAMVRERRQLLRDLRRKYGETLADVLAFQADAEARLTELQGYEQRVQRLEAERLEAEHAERAAAAAVAAKRRSGASELAAAVQANLRELAMPHAELRVTVGDDDPGDDVQFLLAANPGSLHLPLAKVASGGELARAMLALRLVLTEAPDTLVFDEVDAGIGGAAAVAVADALGALGERHQVLVVTHLAQVAARARVQIAVSKTIAGTSTSATARVLSPVERIDEVARMLSGEPGRESARRHAAELLGLALDQGPP